MKNISKENLSRAILIKKPYNAFNTLDFREIYFLGSSQEQAEGRFSKGSNWEILEIPWDVWLRHVTVY